MPYQLFQATLAGRTQLSESFMRVTLTGEELGYCADTLLDQRVKLVLGSPAQLTSVSGTDEWYAAWLAADDRPALRTYTLSAVRAAQREVDIDVVLHGTPGIDAGPASTFAAQAAVGSRVGLVAAVAGTEGCDVDGVAYRPGDASRVVLVADETALPAVVNILAKRREGVGYEVVIEVPCAGDVRELVADRVTWRVRERGESVLDIAPFAGAGADADLAGPDADEVILWDEAEGTAGGTYLWAAGEAGLIRAVRAAAKSAGFDRSSASFMGYWRAGFADEA